MAAANTWQLALALWSTTENLDIKKRKMAPPEGARWRESVEMVPSRLHPREHPAGPSVCPLDPRSPDRQVEGWDLAGQVLASLPVLSLPLPAGLAFGFQS